MGWRRKRTGDLKYIVSVGVRGRRKRTGDMKNIGSVGVGGRSKRTGDMKNIGSVGRLEGRERDMNKMGIGWGRWAL